MYRKLPKSVLDSLTLNLLSLSVLVIALSFAYSIGLNEALDLLHHTTVRSLAMITDFIVGFTMLLLGIDLKKITDLLPLTLSTLLRVVAKMITTVIKAHDVIVDILWVVFPAMASTVLRPLDISFPTHSSLVLPPSP
jgi:hypothetical protein